MVTNFIVLIMKSSCSGSLLNIEKINNVFEGESKLTYCSCWHPNFGLMGWTSNLW
jgi:hypothetical protein